MTRSRMLLALAAIVGISRGGFGGPPANAFAQAKTDSKDASPPREALWDRPVVHGKSIGEWLAALKEDEVRIRRRTIEVLGEYAWDSTVGPGERTRLLTILRPGQKLPAKHPAAGKGPEGGKATAYVVVGQNISPAITDPQVLANGLLSPPFAAIAQAQMAQQQQQAANSR